MRVHENRNHVVNMTCRLLRHAGQVVSNKRTHEHRYRHRYRHRQERNPAAATSLHGPQVLDSIQALHHNPLLAQLSHALD